MNTTGRETGAKTNVLQPPKWPTLPTELMSNLDHEIDRDVERQLRKGNVIAEYAAWDFNADCWFADGQFHAAVFRYRVHVSTMSADSPDELMRVVSDEYGWD